MYTKKLLRAIPLAITGLILGLGITAWAQQRNIYDWWRLRNYEPSAQVRQLADDTRMNDTMRRLFYVYHPQLQEREAFNQSCNGGEKTIVLGCYVTRHGIYIFNVSDQRLEGIKQVTAAHETLHAAYERLSAHDKARIDAQTASVYAALKDERIKETIESYRARDPSVVPNELHSILGTEVQSLPIELELYYKGYFTDRQAVVKLSQQYEQEFTGRQRKVEAADKRLSELKPVIESTESSLESESSGINAEYSRMDAYRRNGQIEEYNSRVPAYNRSVANYNTHVRAQQARITEYNNLVSERNALALEENELIRAIDSRPQTIESQ